MSEPPISVTCDASLNGIEMRSWRKHNLLGKGSFGKVFRITTDEGIDLAVKEIKVPEGATISHKEKMIMREINILKSLNHANIIQSFGFDMGDASLFIFLELMDEGSLSNVYRQRELSLTEVQKCARAVLDGLVYLHNNKILHLDLKGDNVLKSTSDQIKIADFGLSVQTDTEVTGTRGTSHWMAPEVMRSSITNEFFGQKADIWSYGCLLVELITRKQPFPDKSKDVLRNIFLKGEMVPLTCDVPKSMRGIIERCLNIDPDSRPTANQLLDDIFFNTTEDLDGELVQLRLGSPGADCTTQVQNKDCGPVVMFSASTEMEEQNKNLEEKSYESGDLFTLGGPQ